tara:strand:- start:781 stop:987 length:207 start_codon:yes stop_codon:yes gene_type:complete
MTKHQKNLLKSMKVLWLKIEADTENASQLEEQEEDLLYQFLNTLPDNGKSVDLQSIADLVNSTEVNDD